MGNAISMQPFEGITNEQLYASLITLDVNSLEYNNKIQALTCRLKPIIFSIGRGFMRPLGFTADDLYQEAMILVCDIIRKRAFSESHTRRSGKAAQFHTLFSTAFQNKMNRLYRDCVLHNMTPVGTVRVGYAGHEPVFAQAIAWSPAADEYRRKHREVCRRWYDRKLEAEGRTRQPVPTEEERQARKEASKQRAVARALQWQQENREAYNARRAEIRRQKKEGTFVDRRRKPAAVAMA